MTTQASYEGVIARYRKTGRVGFSGPELLVARAAALQDVPPMLDFYCDLLSFSSPQIMTDALLESINRMN